MPGTWKDLKLMQLPSSESPFAGNPMVLGGLYTLKNQSPSENGSETLNTSVDLVQKSHSQPPEMYVKTL